MAVSIEYEPSFTAGVPTVPLSGGYAAPNGELHTYDVAPDGQRFLMIKLAGDAALVEPQWVVLRTGSPA